MGFSAYVSETTGLTDGSLLIFDTIITNSGEAYSSNTGTFTGISRLFFCSFIVLFLGGEQVFQIVSKKISDQTLKQCPKISVFSSFWISPVNIFCYCLAPVAGLYGFMVNLLTDDSVMAMTNLRIMLNDVPVVNAYSDNSNKFITGVTQTVLELNAGDLVNVKLHDPQEDGGIVFGGAYTVFSGILYHQF